MTKNLRQKPEEKARHPESLPMRLQRERAERDERLRAHDRATYSCLDKACGFGGGDTGKSNPFDVNRELDYKKLRDHAQKWVSGSQRPGDEESKSPPSSHNDHANKPTEADHRHFRRIFDSIANKVDTKNIQKMHKAEERSRRLAAGLQADRERRQDMHNMFFH